MVYETHHPDLWSNLGARGRRLVQFPTRTKKLPGRLGFKRHWPQGQLIIYSGRLFWDVERCDGDTVDLHGNWSRCSVRSDQKPKSITWAWKPNARSPLDRLCRGASWGIFLFGRVRSYLITVMKTGYLLCR